jgi:polysaccharide export outer membrane protein
MPVRGTVKRAVSLVFLYACLVGSVAGCGSTSPGVIKEEAMIAFTPEQSAALAQTEGMPYRIQRGDKLAVRFVDYDEFQQPEILVLPDGTATFWGVDQISVAGLTVSELDSVLSVKYRKHLIEPDLSVIVVEMAGRQVYILGDVVKPGLYDMPDQGTSVLGAIALAGGYLDYAAKGSVVQIRIMPDGYLCRQLNLSSVFDTGGFDPVLMDVQPYDIIYVSRSWIGDFAVFSKGLVGSLLDYTRLAIDVKWLQNPQSAVVR